MKILILNGPNLNLLGSRQTDIYGSEDFDSFLQKIEKKYPEINFDYRQSNIEGELIDHLHAACGKYDGIILNAGAYTHTSVAIADAVAAIDVPVIEVHISNIFSREDFRQISFIAPVAHGTISGFGLKSYLLAIESFRME
ncbi:MAG TPA: type II 3-dehydroquinate dehydratase [Bacteroidales bacterium]|nr:type II 3-dehydroquinate dehydratase [Bacteroidales bacterium]